jgi:hypothetical protein
MVVRPLEGSTVARLPRAPRGIPLVGPEKLPLGSVLDARAGVVRVTTARGRGRTQSGVFSEGRFSVRQRRSPDAGATLRLRGGDFSDCDGDDVVRKLHGRGAGDFRTAGRNSVTTTRRATWVVEDRCDGTLTRVLRGQASVLDLGLDETSILTRAKSYLARPR